MTVTIGYIVSTFLPLVRFSNTFLYVLNLEFGLKGDSSRVGSGSGAETYEFKATEESGSDLLSTAIYFLPPPIDFFLSNLLSVIL
jgi:hypothetical protein